VRLIIDKLALRFGGNSTLEAYFSSQRGSS
jgi:hypothetical protein